MPPCPLVADDMYTHPQEALRILRERRAGGMHQKIAENMVIRDNSTLETLVQGGPIGITYRDVTPNFEQHRFLSICDLMDLQPLIFENPRDKFVALNRSKHQMAKMVFFEGFGKRGGAKTKNLCVADFNQAQGKAMGEVPTIFSSTLADFHRDLFLKVYPHCRNRITDISTLLSSSNPSDIYESIFSLSIAHGILLEHFLPDGLEARFTREIILPAFTRAWERHGAKPLVVPFQPTDMEEDRFWFQYPAALLTDLDLHRARS